MTRSFLEKAKRYSHAIEIVALPGIGASVLLVVLPVALWAAANGSLSGTLKDPSGAVVEGAMCCSVSTDGTDSSTARVPDYRTLGSPDSLRRCDKSVE